MLATTTRFRHLTKCDRSPDWNPPAAHVVFIQYANEPAFGHPRQLTSIHTFPVGGRSADAGDLGAPYEAAHSPDRAGAAGSQSESRAFSCDLHA